MKSLAWILLGFVALAQSLPRGALLRPDLPDLVRVKRGHNLAYVAGTRMPHPKAPKAVEINPTLKPEETKPSVPEPVKQDERKPVVTEEKTVKPEDAKSPATESVPKDPNPLADLPTDSVPKVAPNAIQAEDAALPSSTTQPEVSPTAQPVDVTTPTEVIPEVKPAIEGLDKIDPLKTNSFAALPINLIEEVEISEVKREIKSTPATPSQEDSLLDELDTNLCLKSKCGPTPTNMECKTKFDNGTVPKIPGVSNDCCPIYVCRRVDGSTFLHYSIQIEEHLSTKSREPVSFEIPTPPPSSYEARHSAETFDPIMPFISSLLPPIFPFGPTRSRSIITISRGPPSQWTPQSYEDMDMDVQPPHQPKTSPATFEMMPPPQSQFRILQPVATHRPSILRPAFIHPKHHSGSFEHGILRKTKRPSQRRHILPTRSEGLFGQQGPVDQDLFSAKFTPKYEPRTMSRSTPKSSEKSFNPRFLSKVRTDDLVRPKRGSNYFDLMDAPFAVEEAAMPFDDYGFFPY